MVVNPITIAPTATLAAAQMLMAQNRNSQTVYSLPKVRLVGGRALRVSARPHGNRMAKSPESSA